MDLLLEAEKIINSARDPSARIVYEEEKGYIQLGPFKSIVKNLQAENIEIRAKIDEIQSEKQISLHDFITQKLNNIIRQLNSNVIISPDLNETRKLLIQTLKIYESNVRQDMIDIKEDNQKIRNKISQIKDVPQFKSEYSPQVLEEKSATAIKLEIEIQKIENELKEAQMQNNIYKQNSINIRKQIKSVKSRVKTITDVENNISHKYNSSRAVIQQLQDQTKEIKNKITQTKLLQRYSDSILENPKEKLNAMHKLLNEIDELKKINDDLQSQKTRAKINSIKQNQHINYKTNSFRFVRE